MKAFVIVLLLVLSGTLTVASNEQPYIPLWFKWNHADLQVIILPPYHGPINDPLKITDIEYYWNAMESVMVNWERARSLYVSETPEHIWLSNINVTWKTAYQNSISQTDVNNADVIIGSVETLGPILGVAGHPLHPLRNYKEIMDKVDDKCFALNTMEYLTRNNTIYDYYNFGSHEFGHCLGLHHSTLEHDLMYGVYTHQVGTTNVYHCTSNLDVAGLTVSFGDALGHPTNETRVYVDNYKIYPLNDECELVNANGSS